MQHTPDGALGHERAHPLHGRGKAPVEPGHPDASSARDVGDDRFRVLARGRERLFAQHVRSAGRRRARDGAMQVGRRRDDDDVGVFGREHVFPARVGARHAIGGGDLASRGLVALAHGDHPRPGGLEAWYVSAAEAEPDDDDRGRRRGRHRRSQPATPPSTTTRIADTRP